MFDDPSRGSSACAGPSAVFGALGISAARSYRPLVFLVAKKQQYS